MLKLLALFLFLGFVSAAPKLEDIEDDFELPAGIITCQIDSPDRDECIKEAHQDLLSKFVNGMKSLRIPPLDPYKIESQSMSVNWGGGSFNLIVSGNVRNASINGISKAKIIDVKTNITRKHISKKTVVYIPSITSEGYYNGEAQFNTIKSKSKGYFNLTATDINVVTNSESDIIEVNGKEYAKMKKIDILPEFGDFKLFATGRDPILNKAILHFINQNWPTIFPEILPIIHAEVQPQLITEVNKILLHVPLRKILYYGDESA